MDDTPQSQGGKARAEKLSKAERSAIARQGALERWKLPKATHGSTDRPLRIGDVEISCYVLEDGTRVLSQRGTLAGLNLSQGSSSNSAAGADRLARFARGKGISPFVSSELMALIDKPIRFRHSGGGGAAYGYPATILPDICDAVLAARKAGALQKQQLRMAEQCEALVRAFAKVGIVALVDEATGYQDERDRDELHKLLEIYLSAERLAWAKRFPDEFYRQLYRLKNWPWPAGQKRTPLVGKITNKIVYERLPEGVMRELQARNPTEPGTGRRKWKHHQFLSEDIGQPDLRDHLLQLVAVMRVSKDWSSFERNLEEAFPKPGSQLQLLLSEDYA